MKKRYEDISDHSSHWVKKQLEPSEPYSVDLAELQTHPDGITLDVGLMLAAKKLLYLERQLGRDGDIAGLVIYGRDVQGAILRGMTGPIGRHPDCDVWTADPYISKKHATVALNTDGRTLTVTDTDSLNGTALYLPRDYEDHDHDAEPIAVGHGYNQPSIRRDGRGNDDAMIVSNTHQLFAVFDGMGGALHGGDGARQAADLLAKTAETITGTPHLQRQQLQVALNTISDQIAERWENEGMTTVAAVKLVKRGEAQYAAWASAGDSRLYMQYASGEVRQVSRDEGVGRYLTNSLGTDEYQNPVVQGGVEYCPAGSRLILVTDGVTGDYGDDIMSDDELSRHIRGKSGADAARALVYGARKADDRTAIVIDP